LNQEFTGKVVDISRISSTLGGDVVYKVTIDLDQQPQGLLWGMSADVEIETGQ
jgi:HlyD family secretion protein